MDLKSRLAECAQIWVAAQGADVPLSRLGKRVMDNANFFAQLEESRSGPTTSTLEKFARFLVDGGNWPASLVPDQVVSFAHAVGVSASTAPASSGKPDEISTCRASA